MKFSVITPSLNQGRFIEATIASVLDQAYPNYEYWVMDGGSTDETLAILKKYEDHLHWVSQKDKGQADAVNQGMSRTTGEIIAWINADDTFEPGAFHKVAEYFARHPQQEVVYGEACLMGEAGNRLGPAWVKHFPTHAELQDYLAQSCCLCQPAVFFRRTLVERIGMLDAALFAAMDYDYWIRAARHTEFGYIPEHLANARMYADNKTLHHAKRMLRESIRVVGRHYGYVPSVWTLAYAYYRIVGQYPFFPEYKLHAVSLNTMLFNLLLLWRYNLPYGKGRGYALKFTLDWLKQQAALYKK